MMRLEDSAVELLRQDGEFAVSRVRRDGDLSTSLLISPVLEAPRPSSLARLEHAFALRGELPPEWSVRPIELVKLRGRLALLVEDPPGQFLDGLMAVPMVVPDFLRFSIGMARALGGLHARGLVHKDVKPENFLVNPETGEARLTGFGLTSRLPRHKQSPESPEVIAGTLAYMAPEQTGWMNRSIDSRSDLYALGVTLYEMIVGELPFSAGDPMEWVHCHTARQPPSPSTLSASIPTTVSAIVMRLLAKTAEERYQSAAGLESDLRRCLADWEVRGRIGDFELGAHDIPDRLLIPEKLYGRDREVDTLLRAFDRIVAGGRSELVLVSGYSGIGKSAVVNELHRALVPPRGLLASGKFDQYKRDIPYATLAQAFQSLIHPLLSKSEEELGQWRDALREALDPNGALIVDLVPELKHIIGEQPPASDLPPHEAQGRFQSLFRRFIGVFARPEHPLALFLDDLQWLDAATLDLLEDWLVRADVHHLLLIGAYRDNEVASAHPLMRKLAALRQAGAVLHDIVLAPLSRPDLEQLLGDSLRCEPAHAAPLAHLIREKTSGNPFFVIQFLATLADEALLTLDYTVGRWCWDLERIHAQSYTDNVADLMVSRLSRLPLSTREALHQFACLGNTAEFEMLRTVHQASGEALHAQLWDAVQAGLIYRSDNSYRFLHDRVQEAAYSLVPAESRAATHWRIGCRLADHIPPERHEEAIFEIVNQLNRGAALAASPGELERLVEFNLTAGLRARAATAYVSGLKYFTTGLDLLPADSWERRHALAFLLELHRAECEFLVGDHTAAAERLAALAPRVVGLDEATKVACLRSDVYTTLNRSDLAIGVCLDCLRGLGIAWSPHPSFEETRAEYGRVSAQLGDRQIGQLVDLPPMNDRRSLAMLEVITKAVPAAMFTNENLHAALICSAVNLSLVHGNGEGSSSAYTWLGVIARHRFGDYERGFQFGQLGYELVERRGLKRFQAQVFVVFGNMVATWGRHIRTGQDLMRRAFDAACKVGELTYAGYSANNLITNLLATGDALPEVQREAEAALDFVRRARFGLIVDIIGTQLALVRSLRGEKPLFGSFDDEQFHEDEFESHLASHPALAIAECWYWVRKLQLRFLAADYPVALTALRHAERLLWTSPGMFEGVEAHFYGALTHAVCCDTAPPERAREHLESLRAHHGVFVTWAEKCPDNFANRAALLGAELARLEGRIVDAQELYETSIRAAQQYAFVHNEAIAHELAAQFYRRRGFTTIADAYLRNARACYTQWGALGKVTQIDVCFPHLKSPSAPAPAAATIDAPVARLDAEMFIKASQALSSEINLPNLIEKLLHQAVEFAGAQRGLLILLHGDVPYVEGEAKFESGRIEITIRHALVEPGELLPAALQYGLRTRERVSLDDVSAHPSYAGDEYVVRRGLRSVLCLPILKQSQVVGALYLENNLTAHAFTASRVAVLEALGSQASISLENARLYAALERENLERKRIEGELGLIFDNIPGLVVILNAAGAVEFENGRTREYLGPALASTGEWASNGIVCPEDIPRVFPIFGAGIVSKAPFEYDVRLRHESGVYRWFQLRAHPLYDAGGQVIRWYVLLSDIEDRKQAEVIRESEHRLKEMINAIPTSVWTTRPDGYCDFFNQPWLNYAGLSAEEAQGWGWRQTIHPDDAERLEEHWQSCLAVGTPVDIEGRVRRHDGIYRWFLFRGNPLRDESGKILRWFGTNIDIEDRKQAEAIRESEHHLRTIVNSIPGLVCTMSPTGEVQELNQQLLEYFGKTPETLRGWAMTDAVHPDDLSRVVAAFTYSVTTGIPYDVEHRCRRADGVYRWFQIRARPVRAADGSITGWYVLLTDIEERRLAEEAVRTNERHLNEIINTIPTMVWSALPDGSCTFFNQTWLSYTGLTLDQALGWGWTSAFHPDDLQKDVLDYWQSCLTTGTPVDTELRMRRHDGVYRRFLLLAAPLRDESGRIRGWYGTNIDIEDRKQADENLRQNELHLRQMTETIPEMLWSATAEGAIDYCNGRLLEYSGMSASEVMGAGWTKLLHPDDVPHTAQVWLSCVATGTPYLVEVRTFHAADQTYRWCTTTAVPLFDSQGHIVKWYGTVVDMHDRKHAEQELRRSEARKAAILDSALDCFVTIDHDGRITEFNPAAERTFGYRREEVMGNSFTSIVVPPALQQRYEEFANDVMAGEPEVLGKRFELSAIRADGTEFPIEVAITRIRSEGLPSYTGYLRDITDRKRAEEELRHSEARLREVQEELAHVTRVTTMGELAASIAHEVNQPIAGVVINGNASLRWLARLDDDSENLKHARDTIQRIIRDGNRAGEIIARIRALFKKSETTKEPLNLNEAIREIIVLARNEIEKHHAALKLDLAASLPKVRGDRVQLQQVLLNLILNAVDAMATIRDRPRALVIRTLGRSPGEVVVTVEDSGIGVPPERMESIFAAFQTTKPGGLGMGLSISRSIVENHLGRLWVTAHEGPGASFHFTLPAVPPENELRHDPPDRL